MSNLEHPGWVAANGVYYGWARQHMGVGSNRGCCTACGRFFSGDVTFDRHRLTDKKTGEVTCRDPAEFGAIKNNVGAWSMPFKGKGE